MGPYSPKKTTKFEEKKYTTLAHRNFPMCNHIYLKLYAYEKILIKTGQYMFMQ